jgi:hypothetical protein
MLTFGPRVQTGSTVNGVSPLCVGGKRRAYRLSGYGSPPSCSTRKHSTGERRSARVGCTDLFMNHECNVFHYYFVIAGLALCPFWRRCVVKRRALIDYMNQSKKQKSIALEKRAEATYAEYRTQKASALGGHGLRLPL